MTASLRPEQLPSWPRRMRVKSRANTVDPDVVAETRRRRMEVFGRKGLDQFKYRSIYDPPMLTADEITYINEPVITAKRCFIYFVQIGASGPIKIGRTKNIGRRLSGLQVSHHDEMRLLCSIEGPPKLEQQLHHRFKRHRLRGEWFRPSVEILSFIQGIGP